MFDTLPEGESKLYKLGKFCDEPSNDRKPPEAVDFEKGIYCKLVRFGSNAPKSYTAEYLLPSGKRLFKTRLKGIKSKGSRIIVEEKTLLDDIKSKKRRVSSAYDMETICPGAGSISKRQRIDALQTSEMERRNRLLDQSDLSYAAKSESTHKAMYSAILDDDLVMRTRAQQSLKNFGMAPQRFEKAIDASGQQTARSAYDFTVSNVSRDVCGSILTRRRQLNDSEAAFLGLSVYDAGRILVPYGYNYDGALYSLL